MLFARVDISELLRGASWRMSQTPSSNSPRKPDSKTRDCTLTTPHPPLLQQMERFKALEKEMKTKAFSKEGLQAATRLDPAARQKLEARHALEEFVDALSRQIETSEAEIETLQASAAAGGKKKSRAAAQAAASGGGGDKASELERLNERRQWHVGKLEAVMRMLENGRISVDQVNDLKEDVQYFVESNQVRSRMARRVS